MMPSIMIACHDCWADQHSVLHLYSKWINYFFIYDTTTDKHASYKLQEII